MLQIENISLLYVNNTATIVITIVISVLSTIIILRIENVTADKLTFKLS